MQLGNNRSREVRVWCVCVDNWALAHLFCENRQSGGWFLTALLQLSCHGTSPSTPVAGKSEASETAQSLRWVSSGIHGQMASEFLLLLLLVNCGWISVNTGISEDSPLHQETVGLNKHPRILLLKVNDLTWPHAKSVLLPLCVFGACFGIGLALVSELTK